MRIVPPPIQFNRRAHEEEHDDDDTAGAGMLFAHTKKIDNDLANTEFWFAQGFGLSAANATESYIREAIFANAFWVPENITVHHIEINVTVAGAANSIARMGIWQGDSDYGYLPGALLLDAGTQDTSTIGFKTWTPDFDLEGGCWYWFGYCAQASAGAPTPATVETLSNTTTTNNAHTDVMASGYWWNDDENTGYVGISSTELPTGAFDVDGWLPKHAWFGETTTPNIYWSHLVS